DETPEGTTVVAVWSKTSSPFSISISIFVDEPGYIKSIVTTGGIPLWSTHSGTVTAQKGLTSYYIDITVNYFNGLQDLSVTKRYLVPITNPPEP
ncbi:MAG: hypothetical protein ACXADB_10985, partial [Candidatus Hermodarchaeia archaeon]